jgi:RimJ/RimL family protein N-acetyltransferase
MLRITDFDPFIASDSEWDAHYHLINSAIGDNQDSGAFKAQLVSRASEKGSVYKMLFENDAPIAAMEMVLKKQKEDGWMASVTVVSSLAALPDSFSASLADAMIQFNSTKQIDHWRVNTTNTAIRELVEQIGGTLSNTLNIYELSRKEINQVILNQWNQNSNLAELGLMLHQYDYVPDDLYEPFALLMTEMMNDIIREDSSEKFTETPEGVKAKMTQFRKDDIKMLTFILTDAVDNLVGLSILLCYPGSAVAKQQMTGIRKAYRNKKLAAYLKAQITIAAFSHFPEIEKIVTDCYSVNTPIIRLNEALGYVLKERSYQFSMDIEKMKSIIF